MKTIDQEGVLSLDFLAGFLILIFALMFAINMVPGLLVGINSQEIDYDAVAYRTGTILCEDPGWPSTPREKEPWERLENTTGEEETIARIGLSVSDKIPNILSKSKIDRFFDIPERYFDFSRDDIEQKVVFGPYAYNISLKIDNESTTYYLKSNYKVPESSYGYIRRLVKVKYPGWSEPVDCGLHNFSYVNATFANGKVLDFSINLNELYNLSLPDEFRADPRTEPINITIDKFRESLDENTTKVTLTEVLITREGFLGSVLPRPSTEFDDETYRFTIKNSSETYSPLKGNFNVTDVNEFNLILYPWNLAGPSLISGTIHAKFYFDYEFGGYNFYNNYINGTFDYNYTSNTPIYQPPLSDGVLEVVIW